MTTTTLEPATMLSRRRFLLGTVAAVAAAPVAAKAVEDGVALFNAAHPGSVAHEPAFWAGPDGFYATGGPYGAEWSNLSELCSDLTEESLERMIVEIRRTACFSGGLAQSMLETKWNVQAQVLEQSREFAVVFAMDTDPTRRHFDRFLHESFTIIT